MASPLGLSFKNENNGIPSINGRNVNYRVVQGKAVQSIFGSGQFSPYPLSSNAATGNVEKVSGPTEIHADERNDISISSIIEYCSKHSAMKLDYSHFAYLKNVGVFPNNRLIIARRFSAGVGNDLTAIAGPPLSTIVTYFSDQEECFTITFNEVYKESEGSFEEVLNDIGDDVLMGDNKGGKLGTEAAGGFGVIPLPGIMEGVQHIVLNKLGLSNIGGPGDSPLGNPNLIREAKQRDIPGKGKAGSALAAKFTVTMTVEYEQKFINGVDPTLVYLDLIQNALTFGTSDSVFQFSSAFGTGVTGFIKDLISGNVNAIVSAITQFITSLITAMKDIVVQFANQLLTELEQASKEPEQSDDKNKKEREQIAKSQNLFLDKLNSITSATIGTIVSRYKVRLLGIANALTGAPSTPWHVTIGNPKKPIFSSGDMECTKVTLTLGPTLAFNDLPSSIKLDIDLSNARPLGAQEIFNRFNTGRGRSYVRTNLSFVETNDALIQNEVVKKVDQLNKENNAETQKPAPSSSATAQTSPADGSSNKNQATEGVNKGIIIDTPPAVTKDPYLVDFSNTGVEWGVKQTEPPVGNRTVTGDSTTPITTQPVGVTSSNQSSNNPSTPTSILAQATDSSIVPVGTSIPGVASTPFTFGTNPPEFLPTSTGLPLTVPGASSSPVVLPTNATTTSPAIITPDTATQSSLPPPPQNIPAQPTVTAATTSITEPPSVLTTLTDNVFDDDGQLTAIRVLILNNGKVIKKQDFSSVTFTTESALNAARAEISFGVVGNDGRFYVQGQVPK
jgi:hypothetical protein